ncbi:DUF4252 domain-containing protein [Flavimarina sp. Hel_I_48]|uniref:DUF4252 domain-containing protein n=1 Tax=Flavimarina sp. Hel_I_48 TaxID=1392488 RepID=UPI0004DED5C6|nr:DUF4252 domain-containing protein [Flavimarina sp. Hel_I_48]
MRYLIVTFLAIIMVSCNGEQSLQEYYVDHKENNDFVMLDVPANLILPNSNTMPEAQREILKTIKKVNILALPLNSETQALYQPETEKVMSILKRDDYEELMSFGKPSQRMRFYINGEEDAIDEVIVFAQDDKKGFLLARVLGDDMNVAEMVKLTQNISKEDGSFDTAQFEGVMDIFKNN